MHTEAVEIQPAHTTVRSGVWLRSPLIVYAVLYAVTCYVGALALLFSGTFRTMYLVFSGAEVPALTDTAFLHVLLLLHAGPLCLWLGYELGLRFRSSSLDDREPETHERMLAGPWIVFGISVALVCFSFTRVNGWGAYASWIDYNAYIHARLRLFDRWTFFEFVNVYGLLTVSAGYLFLTEKRRALAAAPVIVVLALQAGLAQRRILLLTVLFVVFAAYVYFFGGAIPRRRSSSRKVVCWTAVGALLLYGAYSALTLATVVSARSKPFDEIQRVAAHAPKRSDAGSRLRFTISAEAAAQIEKVRWRAVALYVALSPFTRTSVSAIAYPAVFPALLPFYTVDVGQDILGVGSMPDDNLQVYSLMWPQHRRGAIAAPAHVVFYSQGGWLVAVLGTMWVGAILALLWTRAIGRGTILPQHALCGALVILLAISVTMDSARNAFIVSYGVVWQFAAVAALALSARRTAWSSRASAPVTSR